jgi:hypothetical protein
METSKQDTGSGMGKLVFLVPERGRAKGCKQAVLGTVENPS